MGWDWKITAQSLPYNLRYCSMPKYDYFISFDIINVSIEFLPQKLTIKMHPHRKKIGKMSFFVTVPPAGA